MVSSLEQNAPRLSCCTFLNCELHRSDTGIVSSADLFSVRKPLFRRPQRRQRELNLAEIRILDELGEVVMSELKTSRLTLDVLLGKRQYVQSFYSLEPLHRIGGGNDHFFKSKHKAYVHLEPLLNEIQ